MTPTSDFAARSLPPLLPTGGYTPGVVGPRQAGVIELASNENPCGASPRALAAVAAALTQTHLYPEHDAGSLRRALATHWGVAPEAVIVSPGTTALIDLVARAVLSPGTSAVTSERSFLAYTTAVAATGATLLRAPMRNDAVDLDAILAAIRGDTRLVFLANPNNPTGTAFGRARFEHFLDQLPTNVLVVLDEAYAEYAVGLPDGARDVRAGRPVLALRTFSKVHGLAGLRVGYGLGPVPLIRALSALAPVFGVSHVAQAAALAALADSPHLERAVAANCVGRGALTAGLRALGLRPVPSTANFVYVDLGRHGDPVRDALLNRGVRVRALTAWGAPTAIRITVGTPADVTAALTALRGALADLEP